ncbi:MAG: hypothetical protein PVI30_23505 [Myxococcales bacterium]
MRSQLAHVALQHPLIETAPSLQAVETGRAAPPGAIFAGIGLVAEGGLSRTLPVDVLGLLLSAEEVRRATGASELLVLLADAHAMCRGTPDRVVQQRADAYEDTLRRIALRCGLRRMRLMRATEVHRDPAYLSTLRGIERRAPSRIDPYITREVADITHFVRQHGGLVKVGWALQPSRRGADRDERIFDECFQRWVGDDAWFMYAKAGRAFDDRRRKAPPYAERDADRRICLRPGEDVAAKLSAARLRVSHSTWRGVRRHLGAIARAYGKLVRPLDGPLERRVQAVIDDVFADSPTWHESQTETRTDPKATARPLHGATGPHPVAP